MPEEREDGQGPVFRADCPSRLLLEQIADKWAILILEALSAEPQRFNALKRRVEGITQKALVQVLRRLERNGIVERNVATCSPVSVCYRITALGRTLEGPIQALHAWAFAHEGEIARACAEFDARMRAEAEAALRSDSPSAARPPAQKAGSDD